MPGVELGWTRRPRRMAETAKGRELDGAGGGGSVGVGGAPDAVGSWRAADLDLVEVAEHEAAFLGPAQK